MESIHTPEIGEGTREEKCNNAANRIDRENDPRCWRAFHQIKAEVFTILRVAVNGAHKRPIVAINA